ncbi:TOMM precursor leader peptide-binding protein [Yinghuangia seranimata]|uniref:TOMM precursor leader peptide-binding protein n=1 Tax=Yinghuangia seranimata TaxID=408067 RepID=UPI00248BA003|nr:TOMM precursor leader peptide-binding protein [Yinghuangia seranimata]MDI2130083.1 TOMM precursor leader peptide-binding protein [Yinghuangia seranimata]
MERPRLKAHYLCEVVDDDKVFLTGEGRDFLVAGEAAVALLPYLDGTHQVGEIAAALSGRVPLTALLTTLRRYETAGHLAEGRPRLPESALAFWDAQGVDPAAVASVLGGDRGVAVVACGTADPRPVLAALAEHGMSAHAATPADVPISDSHLTVVVTDDYLAPELDAVNAAHLAAGRPWLPVKPAGVTPWVGPLLTPGRTGCWRCLAQRVAGNRQVERYLAGKRGESVPLHASHASIPAGPALVAALAAAEALRSAATGASPALDGRMVTVDLATLGSESHILVRQPQCPACGDPALFGGRGPKVVLATGTATHTTDGGYRVRPPEATFAALERHISPHLGAITRLAEHDDSANGITYSFTAGHNFAMVNDNMDLLRRNMRGQSGGKGRSEIQAKVSAVCEAIERYTAVWRGDEPVVRAAYRDLDPAAAVHMDRLLLFSPGQVAGRTEWNRDPAHRLQLVPDPFPEDAVLDWSAAWSLTHDEERLLPAGYVWYGHPDLARHFFCVGDSNGSASGNTLEEAVLQGFCEVVERDAVAMWWYNRLRRPAFDLDSLGDPYVATMRDFYASMDRSLWMLDITSDLGLPAFAAVSRRHHAVEDVMVGFGAHPDARIAAVRALTEVNQFLPFVDRRDADGNTLYRSDDLETLTWCREVRVADEPWLLPDPGQPATVLGDFAVPDGHDLSACVRSGVESARACGVEVIVLDQTRPDLDLHVVKVVMPGMRHFWRRLGPGRLYDAPVRTGALERPRTEAEMNRWNVFF